MRRIWVDTDVALGAARGDVDDAYALAAVARAPGVELLGVSTVFGNTRVGIAADCARRLLEVSGARVEVVPGAEKPGVSSPAAEAMARLPAGTSLLALGPLTNVAAAFELDPSLAGRVEVRAVGGNLTSRGRWPPWWPFEFNFAKDPAAAHAVFAAACARRIFPLCVCHRLRVGLGGLRQLARLSPVGEYVARGSWRWLAYAPLRYRALSFALWDLVPALDALGVLAVVGAELKLAPRGRGRLEPAVTSSWWARGFDPVQAWTAFCQLVSN